MIFAELEGAGGFRLMGTKPFPQSICIESHRIEACMDYALRHHSGRISISPLEMGFDLPDLSFLSRFPWVEHLTILNADMIDISAVSSLVGLRCLQLSGKAKQPLDLATFPKLRKLRATWWPKLRFGDVLTSLRVLGLSNYSSACGDFTGLPEIPQLEDLDLVQSHSSALAGIERFQTLKRLTVSYFPKLVDLAPLAAFKTSSLEVLEFGHCRRLAHHDQAKVIPSLR